MQNAINLVLIFDKEIIEGSHYYLKRKVTFYITFNTTMYLLMLLIYSVTHSNL